MSAAVPASSAIAALTRLDGYMAAAGYDTDHPWRLEIASTQNVAPANAPTGEIATKRTSFVSPGAHCTVHVRDIDVDDRIDLLTAQLVAILRVLPSDGYAPHIARVIQMTAQTADELFAKARNGEDGTSVLSDIAELLDMIQDDDRTDHLHWLCQQITNELIAIFTEIDKRRTPQ